MEKHEILVLIDNLEYDLETVWCLIDFGRMRDSALIMERLLNKVQLFQSRISEGPYNLEGVFTNAFWEKKLTGGLNLSDARRKIVETAQKDGVAVEEELEKMGCVQFFGLVRAWVNESIHLLKRAIKSSLRKKVEKSLIAFVLCLIALTAVGGVICFFRDRTNWGLRSEFYQGDNFQKNIRSGYSKTIDFSSCNEMNNRIAKDVDHFTARWRGRLIISNAGVYVFTVKVSDGLRLFIDDRLLTEAWKIQAPTDYQGKIFLNSGLHTIRINYGNLGQKCMLKLYWEGPGIKKEIIPNKYLRF